MKVASRPSVVAPADVMSNAAGFDASTALSMPWALAVPASAQRPAMARKVGFILFLSIESIHNG